MTWSISMTWSLANHVKRVKPTTQMSVVYLLLGGGYTNIGGIFTPDGFHVFSIHDFMLIVLTGKKSRKYVQNLWACICRQHSQFMEVPGTLALAVPSTKMPKRKPIAGTTVAGLSAVLNVLGSGVAPDCRKVVEDIFARYMLGDRSMIVEVNLHHTQHPQIPRLSYNFQPPTASAQEPVASMLIEAGAGADEHDLSSRETSVSMDDSIEFDFISLDDHIVRAQS